MGAVSWVQAAMKRLASFCPCCLAMNCLVAYHWSSSLTGSRSCDQVAPLQMHAIADQQVMVGSLTKPPTASVPCAAPCWQLGCSAYLAFCHTCREMCTRFSMYGTTNPVCSSRCCSTPFHPIQPLQDTKLYNRIAPTQNTHPIRQDKVKPVSK